MAVDDIVQEEEKIEYTIWDYLVSAYSSSKGVKVCLSAISVGYSILGGLLAGAAFYIFSKAVGLVAKYMAEYLFSPDESEDIIEYVSARGEYYNPLGPLRRPHTLGATLSTVSYVTGF